MSALHQIDFKCNAESHRGQEALQSTESGVCVLQECVSPQICLPLAWAALPRTGLFWSLVIVWPMKSTLRITGFSMITFIAIAKYYYNLMGVFKNAVQTQRSLTIVQQLLLDALIKM